MRLKPEQIAEIVVKATSHLRRNLLRDLARAEIHFGETLEITYRLGIGHISDGEILFVFKNPDPDRCECMENSS